MSDAARLFFALPLPENVRAAVVTEQDRLRSVAATHGIEPKWALPEQWHVTAKFLGAVPRDRLEALRATGSEVASRHPGISATLGATTVFGRRRTATVLFVGVNDDGALGRLAADIETATTALGHAREPRRYVPHVTLARFREPTMPDPFLGGPIVTTDVAHLDRLRLYESVVTSEGGRYTMLQEWALGRERPLSIQ